MVAAVSPKCSGTASWGKIRYQVCFRWNCDSTKCNVLGYLGLINTATSARTVNWDLDYALDGGAFNNRQTRLCVRNEERLSIDYDGTLSTAIFASETIGCL